MLRMRGKTVSEKYSISTASRCGVAHNGLPCSEVGGLMPASVEHGCCNVDVHHELRRGASGSELCRVPDEQRDANGFLVRQSSLRPEAVLTVEKAVVRREDDDRVVEHAPRFKRGQDAAERFVDCLHGPHARQNDGVGRARGRAKRRHPFRVLLQRRLALGWLQVIPPVRRGFSLVQVLVAFCRDECFRNITLRRINPGAIITLLRVRVDRFVRKVQAKRSRRSCHE